MNVPPEIAEYMYDLPPELIAQEPPKERGSSRLMLLNRFVSGNSFNRFDHLPDLLPPGALLIFNDVRVTQARLLGRRTGTGGQVEAFILAPPAPGAPAGGYDLWCLVQPGRRLKPGASIDFSHPNSELILAGEILEVAPDGRRLIRFHFSRSPERILDEVGHVPLPVYIKRPDTAADRERYQTVYGKIPGAAAAPTAGLHFSRNMLDRLEAAGWETAGVTLRVSAGTFLPLTSEHLTTGRLHKEHMTVPETTVQAVLRAKAEGRPVLAVGTTTVRSLEWAAENGNLMARDGWGDLFIRPGYKFRVVDALLTNFHLPGSSLLMLVAALAGRGRVMEAYAEAIKEKMRFYSYGDAMLVI